MIKRRKSIILTSQKKRKKIKVKARKKRKKKIKIKIKIKIEKIDFQIANKFLPKKKSCRPQNLV
jgi:stalled ribosome rescue protein Dom34